MHNEEEHKPFELSPVVHLVDGELLPGRTLSRIRSKCSSPYIICHNKFNQWTITVQESRSDLFFTALNWWLIIPPRSKSKRGRTERYEGYIINRLWNYGMQLDVCLLMGVRFLGYVKNIKLPSKMLKFLTLLLPKLNQPFQFTVTLTVLHYVHHLLSICMFNAHWIRFIFRHKFQTDLLIFNTLP